MQATTLRAPQKVRARAVRLFLAALLVALAAAFLASDAFAGTDTWCSGCHVNPQSGKTSIYDHHFTLVYSHELDIVYARYVGAGVVGCYGIAHAYTEVSHSYSTPCLAYGYGENADYYDFDMNIHGDF